VPSLDDALQALYRAPLADFVARRKEAAAALRATGDKDAAAQLAARRRPTVSAWVVNQLYWQVRPAFHALLAAAERIRRGDLAATAEHRQAMATLRQRAADLLAEADHVASDATLRRVTTTLAALAAKGGFDPDVPGTLAEDRDPPGFEAMALSVGAGRPAQARHTPAKKPPSRVDPETRRARMREDAAARAAGEAERRRRDTERKRRTAERQRIETRLRTARIDVAHREERLAVLRKELRLAEETTERARAGVMELERALAATDEDER
jgi:hypothetical protein